MKNKKEHGSNVEKLRKALEQQVKDLQTRLDEAEANALKGGKRIIQKLEIRVSKNCLKCLFQIILASPRFFNIRI